MNAAALADARALALIGALAVAVLAVADLVRRTFAPDPEIPRKLAHAGLGLIAATFPWVFESPWAVTALCGGFALLMELTRRQGGLACVNAVERRSSGTVYFPVALAVLAHTSLHRPWLWVPPVLVLSISDALAAVVGRSYGQTRFRVGRGEKSVEGSLAFLTSAFLCVHLPLLFLANPGKLEGVLVSLVVAILMTGLEALGARGTDNALIPFAAQLSLAYLMPLEATRLAAHVAVLVPLSVAVFALSRMAWNLTASAALSVIGAAYASWVLADGAGLIPVALCYVWFSLLWTVERPTREVYHLPAVAQVFGVPLAVLAVTRATGGAGMPLPFLAAVACAFALAMHVRLVLTRRPVGLVAKLAAGVRATATSLVLLVAPALAWCDQLAPAPLARLAVVQLVTIGLYVGVHEVRGRSRHFFGRLVLFSSIAAALAGIWR